MWTKKQIPSMTARRFSRLTGSRFYKGCSCICGCALRYTASGNCVSCSKMRSSIQYYLRKAAKQ